MLLRLRSTQADSSQAALEPLLELSRALGYASRFLDRDRRIVELTRAEGAGPGAPSDRSRFEDLTIVQAVLDASDAPELSDRVSTTAPTVVRIGDATFGGGHVSIIAGPCAVEDESDLVEVAAAVRDAGATLLRAGAFKPRTSPHSFRGLGRAALDALVRAREASGLPFVTEVLDPRDVELVAGVADALQIGSRSMSNAALLEEAGRSGLPVLVKRGLAATVREFLLAGEYVLATGNDRVILCERGIRTFDTVTRNLLDVGAVAHLKGATHLPVIVDPSHAAGRSELVGPLARAGIAAGADGLIVEVHTRPEVVHSDGAQAVSPAELRRIVDATRALAELDDRTFHAPARGALTPPNRKPEADVLVASEETAQ